MGLFDGASGRGELASTAHVAKLLDAPVLLVVDAASMARSAAAIVHGFRTFDPTVRVAGVIFNRVGSDHHEQLLRDALADLGVPVLGALRRDERVATPERHLGLVPADEREARARAALGHARRRRGALRRPRRGRAPGALRAARRTARPGAPSRPGERVRGARIAIARGPAFSFHYQENLELLEASGAELQPFDPIERRRAARGRRRARPGRRLPRGLRRRARRQRRRCAPRSRAFARSGRPVLAECGGLLYLAAELDGQAMCGALPVRASDDAPADARLPRGDGRQPDAVARRGRAGARARVPLLRRSSRSAATRGPPGSSRRAAPSASEGFVAGGVQASFLHVHWAAFPQIASRLAASRAGAGVSAPPLVVVGIGADGWAGLGEAARAAVLAAEVIVGSQRQLALVPDSDRRAPAVAVADRPARRRAVQRERAGAPACSRAAIRCCTASAPRSRGASAPAALEVHPHPSALALACARLGWPEAEVELVSAVGRPAGGARALRCSPAGASSRTPRARRARASSRASSCERGFGPSRMVVLEQLGGAAERVAESTAAGVGRAGCRCAARVAVECRAAAGHGSWLPAHRRPARRRLRARRPAHEARDPRRSRSPRSRPRPGQLLWDVGAGSGSIGIEWLRAEPTARAIAVEARAERAQRALRNALALGVPRLDVREGRAPAALAGLPAPDAIFIGGGLTEPGLIERCWEALRPGGRLVANAVTLEGEQVLAGGPSASTAASSRASR